MLGVTIKLIELWRRVLPRCSWTYRKSGHQNSNTKHSFCGDQVIMAMMSSGKQWVHPPPLPGVQSTKRKGDLQQAVTCGHLFSEINRADGLTGIFHQSFVRSVIDPGCPVPDSCYELHALVRQVLDISWSLIMALWTVGSVLRDLKILRNIALLIFVVGESVSQLQEGLFFDPHDFLSLLPGSSGQNFNSLRLTSKRTFL